MSKEEPIVATPQLRAAQRWNVVWVVPILALLIGGSMLYRNISSKGPEVRIRFETAEGVFAGTTELRCRSVSIGKVSRVELAEDLQSVFVYCTLDSSYADLLRKGSRFWVVRPRVSAADISGLGTLLTGVYIEMEPGVGPKGPTQWKGRETPPSTNRSVPGLRLKLISDEAGSLIVGSPLYYRGLEVGRVENRKLDMEMSRIIYDVFVPEKYRTLVRDNTKFWNTSGIDISAGVDGFKVRTPSLQAMVSGGVSFAIQDGIKAGEQAKDGTTFELHKDIDDASSSTFNPTLGVLLLFDQSVRGLTKSAPVEYRGIEIGRVKNISLNYALESQNQRVPVLVEVDPKLLRAIGRLTTPEDDILMLGNAVKDGLRATLKIGSLLTGAMFVDFDYYPNEKAADLAYEGDFPVVPTLSSGFAQLEVKLTSILDKIDALPLDEAVTEITSAAKETAITVADAREALKQIEGVSAAAKVIMEDENFQNLSTDLRRTLSEFEKSLTSVGPDGNLQGDFLRTLDELRGAIRSFKAMSDAIKEKPNSLLFGKEDSGNPKPKSAGER